jgi:hypothetical protein
MSDFSERVPGTIVKIDETGVVIRDPRLGLLFEKFGYEKSWSMLDQALHNGLTKAREKTRDAKWSEMSREAAREVDQTLSSLTKTIH